MHIHILKTTLLRSCFRERRKVRSAAAEPLSSCDGGGVACKQSSTSEIAVAIAIALPNLTDLAYQWSIRDAWGAGYGRIGERVLARLADTREVSSRLWRSTGPRYVSVEDRVRCAFRSAEAAQMPRAGTIRFHLPTLDPSDNGIGHSVRNGLRAALRQGGIPLGFAHVGALLAGWPERCSTIWSLGLIYCADRYSERGTRA